jgi:hypothetical protein
MNSRQRAGLMMTALAVLLLGVAVLAYLAKQYIDTVILVLLAVGVGWVTHPIRYTIDPRYRRRTQRTRWG